MTATLAAKTAPPMVSATSSSPTLPMKPTSSGRLKHLGPLTTAFTPPTTCTSGCQFVSAAQTIMFVNGCFEGDLVMRLNSDCFPSTMGNGTSQVYSPGHSCPIGYGPSCTALAPGASYTQGSGITIWDSLTTGETAVGCCPSGFRCHNSQSYLCLSVPDVSETIWAWATDGTPKYKSFVVKDRRHVFTMLASRVVLVDSSNVTTSSLSLPPSQGATSAALESNKLTSGAMVGVIFGASSLLVAAIFINYCRSRRRRRAKLTVERSQPADKDGEPPHLFVQKAELPDEPINAVFELDGTSIFQLPAGEEIGSLSPLAAELESFPAPQ